MKEGVGSISQRYGSGDPDPHQDPHQNVTDPQHCMVRYVGTCTIPSSVLLQPCLFEIEKFTRYP
jgi:hypothetical protein